LAEPADAASRPATGLTLAEMKAAAAQAGFDPVLVERAAALLRAEVTAAPSFTERLIGGRTRHGSEGYFPIVLDEAGAARLLSAVRIRVGRPGEGHSGPTGVTWRSSDDGGAVLSLTALADPEGTSVSVDLDRRGTLVVGGTLAVVASFLALVFGGSVAGEIMPGLEPVGAAAGASIALAVARSYWASSTRRARERVGRVMDSISRFLAQPGNAASGEDAASRSEAAGTDGERAGGTS
jgi:hypothetical protein